MARRRRWIAAGLVLLIAVSIAVAVLVARGRTDTARIRALARDFTVAVDREDQAKIVSLLCAAEAGAVTGDDGYDPAHTGGAPAADGSLRITVTGIRVTGDTATARVSRGSRAPVTLNFRREAGGWRVCAPTVH
ncbi:MAG TPA: hypothetical protein VJT31_30135 [Rugosimonospora sp.]|nr:hypothetical protein [Rugosimonospora sp.]